MKTYQRLSETIHYDVKLNIMPVCLYSFKDHGLSLFVKQSLNEEL